LTRKGNPQTYYVNPSYKDLLQTSISTAEGKTKSTLESMKNVPSAFWIDVKSKVWKGNGHPDLSTVEGILEDAANCDPPHLVLFMVYDLPNRDCWALASNGEVCCHYADDTSGRGKCKMGSNGFYEEVVGNNCKEGLEEYQESYIKPFAEVVKRFDGVVPIVLVIEPDSLPNMVTNMKDMRPNEFRGCNDESKTAYMDGISYAVNEFAESDASIYLDAGHGGWLGWANSEDDKALKFLRLIGQMGIKDKMRGFATNVANYQPIGDPANQCRELGQCIPSKSGGKCCQEDPCKLGKNWNWAHNEYAYVDLLKDRAKQIQWEDIHFIVDTGRNGRPEGRTSCSNWCNPRDNGIGRVPMTTTFHERIDAFYWLKTPGESDGCTSTLPDPPGGKCARFDKMCESKDSLGAGPGEPLAPEAGLWYDYQIKQLASNAKLAPGGKGDQWWVDQYMKGLQCKSTSSKCARSMPVPPKAQLELGPGKCSGNHGGCKGGARTRLACFKGAPGQCSWEGCGGGSACNAKDHNGHECPEKDRGACEGEQKCVWEEEKGPCTFLWQNATHVWTGED
jgi:cellulose 1,4-beta-cellobiosidase